MKNRILSFILIAGLTAVALLAIVGITFAALLDPVLAISKSGPASAAVGAPITYTLAVANNGDVAATGLLVTDTLPAGSTYVSGGTLVGNQVQWNVPSLGSGGATLFLQFVVTVPGGGPDSITNSQYGVTANGGFSASGSNSVVTNILQPSLAISKNGPASAAVGTPIIYTLTVTNSGEVAATNPLITDTLPAGATYVSGGILVGNQVRWEIADLAAGASTSVQFTVVVQTSDLPSIINSQYGITAEGGYTAIGSVPVITTITTDATIGKSGPATAFPDEPITYTLTVNNTGDVTMTNLLITDTLPAGAVYLGGGTLVGDEVQWSVAELGIGAAVSVQFTVTVPAGGAASITNDDYGVTADGGITAYGANPVTTVLLIPQLAISKTGPDYLAPGSQVQYTLTITNSGAVTATNLVITDLLPAGATYISGGTLVGNVVSWTVPLLAGDGASVTVNFTVTSDQPVLVNDEYGVIADDGYSAAGSVVVVTTFPTLYLPAVFQVPYTAGEPNDNCNEAYPIQTNLDYNFPPDDQNDWYQLDLAAEGNLVLSLTNFTPLSGQIAVFRGAACFTWVFLGNNGTPGLTKILDLGLQPAGHYFVYISNDGIPTNIPYTLRVNFTQ